MQSRDQQQGEQTYRLGEKLMLKLIFDVHRLKTYPDLLHAKVVRSNLSIAKMLALTQVDKRCLRIKTLASQ